MKVQEIWGNWSEMSLKERVARRIALRVAPRGINTITKVWVDNNWEEYVDIAKAVIQECSEHIMNEVGRR